MQVSRLATLVLAAAVFGCGGGGDGGTTNPPPPPPPPPPTQTLGSITINPSSTINLAAGGTQTITVTALDTQGAVIPNAGTPTFSVAPAGFAAVSATGVVVGVAAGSAVVTVSLTRGGVTRTATVNVVVTGSLPATASVSTTGDVFTPGTVTISRGGSVTWTFVATIHNVTFQGGAGVPANITDRSNTTESRTFSTVGDFSYTCTLHAGMNGQVIVR